VKSAHERGLPLLIAGDIFHTPRIATEMLYMVIEELTNTGVETRILAGNHDMIYHNYAMKNQTSFGVLSHSIQELKTNELWNASPFGLDDPTETHELVFSHQLVFPNAQARPMNCPDLGRTAEEVLEQFPNAKIVCVGDYHHKFVYTAPDGRMVINPGCTIRQVVDMKDYRPSFYVVDTEAKTVEEVEIPDDYGLVTDEYLRTEEESSATITAFVEAIKSGKAIDLDFRANLERRFADCRSDVKTMIEHLMQETFNEEKK
jgi:DNA repair exonuclease SbcCD nuclease subunit